MNLKKVWLSLNEDNMEMYLAMLIDGLPYKDIPKVIASILLKDVADISVKDQTTVEREVTAGRLLLTGPLALVWKKKVVSEAAYLVVSWIDGRFTHETYFKQEGEGSLTKMNIARNILII